MDAPIKVIKGFIKEPEIGLMIEHINRFERDKREYFSIWQDGKRIALPFGNAQNDIKSNIIARRNLDLFSQSERELVSYLFSRILKEITKFYALDRDIYICSFWLAKQYPGAIIPEHMDTDGGVNMHFEHSVVLYLNTLKSGGDLTFPDLNISHKPEAGDLVFFTTRDTGRHLVERIPEDRYSLVFWTTRDRKLELK
jgi:hypothetical protein